MNYLKSLITRYKNRRSNSVLTGCYTHSYALVGLGNHCIENLLPVIHHLQLPLKYVCCTSKQKANFITRKYPGVKGTVSLPEILNDRAVSGVFVATHPQAHFDMAGSMIEAGKALFIEKPPCKDGAQLSALLEKRKQYGEQPIIVGLQRRFAPATHILRKQLKKDAACHYHYRYLTGLYPEGDTLLDLMIHPLDYVSFLFGPATIKASESIQLKNGGQTWFILLQHQRVTGIIELSTAYSWAQSEEQLDINTNGGRYTLHNLERLNFCPKQPSPFGIPLEKVFTNSSTRCLYSPNSFIPTVRNNSIYTQGFFTEIKTFAEMVEKRREDTGLFGLESLAGTYALIDQLRKKGNV